MLIKEKVQEITNGDYHYKNKKVESLLLGELVDYKVNESTGNVKHILKSNHTIKKWGGNYPVILIISLATSGENKGKWRIAVSYASIPIES